MSDTPDPVFKEVFAPGHFYSVVPTRAATEAAGIKPGKPLPRTLTGIDTHDAEQLSLLAQLGAFGADFPYVKLDADAVAHLNGKPLRYHLQQQMFPVGDALVLHTMLRHFKPKRVVEIGSGFSSAVMLDTDEHWLGANTELTFIEPYPERLLKLLGEADHRRADVITKPVQDAPLSKFEGLEDGDLLFIDCSHVGKTGSDLLYILFEILPRVRPGVLIHFHDIFWPFEYPINWYRDGRAWNEAFYLRTLLTGTSQYRIVLHNHYAATIHGAAMKQALPRYFESGGGSLYLRKLGS